MPFIEHVLPTQRGATMKFNIKRLAFVTAISSAMIVMAAGTPAYAQHGGHHGGGHGIGHGGHSFGHGGIGHGFRHGGHSIGHGGNSFGHGLGHSIGHGLSHSFGHVGSHYGGHIGIGHVDHHSGFYGGGHHGLGHHSYYPHVDIHATPYYSGYGYSSGIVTPYYGYYGQSPPSIVSSPMIVNAAPSASSHTVAKPAISADSIPPTSTTVSPSVPVDSGNSNSFKVRAEDAFRNSNYNEAARLSNHALVDSPNDGKQVLFFAQTLFAIGDYQGAASAIHRAASLLDPEQWGYVVENYKQYYRGNGYADQMARLNDFIKSNPDSASALFVRGYQFGFLGQTEVAIRDLNRTLKIESRDQLAAELVTRFGGVPVTETGSSSAAPEASVAPAMKQEPIEIDFPSPAPMIPNEGGR